MKLSDSASRRRIAKGRVRILKAKVKAAQLEVGRAVEDYKKFEDFKLKLVEGCIDSYHLVFSDCENKVAKAFLTLDLWYIVESDEEGEEEEDDENEEADGGTRELVKVKTRQANIEAILGMISKGVVEGIITEGLIDVETITIKAAKDWGLAWVDIHR